MYIELSDDVEMACQNFIRSANQAIDRIPVPKTDT
jgi:hypothetical protein